MNYGEIFVELCEEGNIDGLHELFYGVGLSHINHEYYIMGIEGAFENKHYEVLDYLHMILGSIRIAEFVTMSDNLNILKWAIEPRNDDTVDDYKSNMVDLLSQSISYGNIKFIKYLLNQPVDYSFYAKTMCGFANEETRTFLINYGFCK